MKKRYQLGLKLLAALVMTISLLAVSFGGVVTMYGLSIGALSSQSPTETGYVRTLALSGPGGNGYYGQTVEDMKSYYQYLNSKLSYEKQQTTVLKSEYSPDRSNVRVRLVSVDSNGEMNGIVATLGGDWVAGSCVLVTSTECGLENGQVGRIDVGFDSAFSVEDDALGRYLTGYRFVRTWVNIGLLPITAVGVVLTVVLGIYLLLAAGHRADEAEEDGIRLRFFDRWPAILLGVLLIAVYCIFQLTWEGFNYTYTAPAYTTADAVQIMTSSQAYGIDFMLTLTALLIWGFALVCFFVLRTVAVRVKAHCFWRTTLAYYILHPIVLFAKRQTELHKEHREQKMVRSIEQAVDASFQEVPEGKPQRDTGFVMVVDGEKAKGAVQGLARKVQDAAGKAADKARSFDWEGSRLQHIWHRVRDTAHRLWQNLCEMLSRMSLLSTGMLCGTCVVALFWIFGMSSGEYVLVTLLAVAVLIGLAWVLSQLSQLLAGAKHLSEGDLAYKIDPAHLHGPFRRYGELMNQISRGCAIEVERRMKSEHLKTELLTNVSHDIKTPLTSIINYVDLIQKTDLQPEEAREYADVLARQSQRLKKLLEDLIEASKASTGNIPVELAPTDAAELLRQAAGEYSERLKAQNLTTVLRVGETAATIMADGRLLWRVFDNLLGNIVKYALSGTRVYLDIVQRGSRCSIVVKNISREELDLDTDELMERFIRGDAARATEGSGLGLSIARSLTECMGGAFDLAVDGDLFKVTLTFPVTTPEAPQDTPPAN